MCEEPDARALFRGRASVVAAALLWSLSGLFVKGGPLAELPLEARGPLLACYRALFAAFILLPWLRPRAMRWRAMLIPMTLSFAAMNLLFVTAITRTTAAAAIFLQYTSSVWAFLFGVILLREPVQRGQIPALCLAVCGIALIVAGDWRSANVGGNLFALGSGLCYAGVVVCLRFLRDEDSCWLVILNHAVAGLVLLPWAIASPVRFTAAQWGFVAAFGVLQMGLPYLLFARGVRTVTAQEAALIPLFEPVLNPLWVALVWHEAVPLTTILGGALIVGGLGMKYVVFTSRLPPAAPDR